MFHQNYFELKVVQESTLDDFFQSLKGQKWRI